MRSKGCRKTIFIFILTTLFVVSVFFTQSVGAAALSEEEAKYVEQKQELRVVFVEHSVLFFSDEKNEYSGLAYELLECLHDKTGLKITYTEVSSYLEAIQMVENGGADIMPTVVEYFQPAQRLCIEENRAVS